MRNTININSAWKFKKNTSEIPVSFPEDWESICVPHTWNGTDGQDGGNDYFRGKCCYCRQLPQITLSDSEQVFIQFDAVNSSAEVYINGKKAGSHDGGYSRFNINITDFIGNENNFVTVVADNAPNDRIYPQKADFTFYGGIYRDVRIITVPLSHFDMEYFGGDGLKITPAISENEAIISTEAFITNPTESQSVVFSICDNEMPVTEQTVPANSAAASMTIKNVHLWNGKADPHLYTMTARLLSDGVELDCVTARFGCRTFEINPQTGFILNGKPYELRGVSRHQDRPVIGNALLPEHHREDIDMICEVGATTVRLAHYQHNQYFYDLCDEKGLVVWAEIPYISSHMKNGRENTVSQMRELIVQNYNHPSIIVWGLSNEITMDCSPSNSDLLENHRILNDLVHSMDKTRQTVEAVLSGCPTGKEYVHLPDVVSFNHYYGWYGGDVSMYAGWFDKFHKKYPDKAIGMSEYGCEALNWHTSEPKQGDYSEEYQAYYHEEVIKQIIDRPWIWATHVWNMFDFAADSRAEGGENGMNHKGLVTFDRKYKKDSFYAYKAWLSDEPFVHICGKRYINRTEDKTVVTIYTNQPEVELFANGKSIGKQQKGKYPFYKFTVSNNGETKLCAKAGECSDESHIIKVEKADEAYIMQDANPVINWFEIDTPEGFFSVNDKIGDIIKSPKGLICCIKILKIAKSALSGGSENDKGNMISVNLSTIKMAFGFTVKRALSMANDKFTKEQIIAINKMLNSVKKRK